MLKVLKNLKKSALSVVVIVLLLCLQAWADLELPNYTSKIVNIGIQQGGIENVATEVILKSQMENILLFTNEDEKILSYYEFNTNSQLSKKVKKYFGTEEPPLESVYVLKDLTKEEQQILEGIITKPFMASYSLTSEEIGNQIKEQILQNVPEEAKIAFQQMSTIEIIKNMKLFYFTK